MTYLIDLYQLQYQMDISKEKQKPIVKQLLVLITILALPILFIVNYQQKWLNAIDVDQNLLTKTIELEKSINQTLQQLKQERLLKTPAIFPKNNIFADSQRSDFQLNIADRIQTNGWIGAISNIRKFNIINVAIHSDYEGNKLQLQKRIMRGLQWFSQAYQMNLQFVRWNNTIMLEQVGQNTVLVVFQQFRNEFVEENIGSRLRKGQYANEFYINQIVKQLRITPLFSHCKFTNQPCTQKTILIMPQYSYEGCNMNIQHEFYILDKVTKAALFELIADVLDLSQLQRVKNKMEVDNQHIISLYKLLKNISFYRESQKILKYVRFIMSPITGRQQKIKELINRSYDQLYEYLLHGKYLSPYIHNLEEKQIIQRYLDLTKKQLSHQFDLNDQKLQVDPLTDIRVGKIDIFANNFKVGVYLPLFVVFCYPIFIKLKELLEYLFAKIRGKGGEKQKIKEE